MELEAKLSLYLHKCTFLMLFGNTATWPCSESKFYADCKFCLDRLYFIRLKIQGKSDLGREQKWDVLCTSNLTALDGNLP